jgi:hypothetical protein
LFYTVAPNWTFSGYFMKKVLFAGLLLAITPLVLAEDLIIGKGEEYLVTTDKMNQAVDKLVIGDNATVKFADGVDHWELLAKDATIGYGVVIDGSGRPGTQGEMGESYDKQAKSCRAGKSGKGGEAGGNGYQGIDIYLGLDARKIGKMKVLADGGDGGAGGAGGAGQDAGNIVNCPPSRGGNGGAGGPGGDGGRGGNVVVSVNPLETEFEAGALTAGIRVSVKPGAGGKGGESGPGGAGSEGTYVNQKTLSGSKKWVGGGPRGRFGSPGEDGEEGSYGQVFVGGKFTGFPEVSTHTDGFEGFEKYRSAVDPEVLREREKAQEEIDLLKEQLKQLQERMEKLEK